jgi:hypothetical protein
MVGFGMVYLSMRLPLGLKISGVQAVGFAALMACRVGATKLFLGFLGSYFGQPQPFSKLLRHAATNRIHQGYQ